MQPLEENFRLLRVQLQDALPTAAVIVVGSAIHGDGTTYTACGLARAFAEAGKPALLLDANATTSGIANELGITTHADPARPGQIDGNLSVARLSPTDDRQAADAELDDVIAGVRDRYAVAVVDAPPIPGSALGLRLAQRADGVLFAVRLGRPRCAADEEVRRLLQPGGLLHDKAVAGIVPTRAVTRRAGNTAPAAVPVPALLDVLGRRFVPDAQPMN